MDKKIIKLANSLSNDELCALINCTSDRIRIFVGSLNDRQVVTEITWATTNGPEIQINTTLSEYEDMNDVSYHGPYTREHQRSVGPRHD